MYCIHAPPCPCCASQALTLCTLLLVLLARVLCCVPPPLLGGAMRAFLSGASRSVLTVAVIPAVLRVLRWVMGDRGSRPISQSISAIDRTKASTHLSFKIIVIETWRYVGANSRQ